MAEHRHQGESNIAASDIGRQASTAAGVVCLVDAIIWQFDTHHRRQAPGKHVNRADG